MESFKIYFFRGIILMLGFWFGGMPDAEAYRIRGIIHLDFSWKPEIYLSSIRSFEDLNTASEDFAINKTAISEDGSFLFEGENLPAGDYLYRLHVVKKGDPTATLFIGGSEENHVHFVMNNDSDLLFLNENRLFNSCSIIGHSGNDVFQAFIAKIDELKRPTTLPSKASWDYKEQQINQYLRHFADTCSYGLVALYAVHQFDILQEYQENPAFYDNLLKKLEPSIGDASYFREFRQQVLLFQNQKKPKIYTYFFLTIIILIPFLYFIFFLKRKNNIGEHVMLKKQQQLTIQEQKIFELLSKGKANKEISSELHIEVSTVKSHVNNIYAKLGVKSRKEIYHWRK